MTLVLLVPFPVVVVLQQVSLCEVFVRQQQSAEGSGEEWQQGRCHGRGTQQLWV